MKALKKKPIQICIEPQQDYVLATLSRRKGISKAEIIRESLDRYLRAIPIEEDPALAWSDLGIPERRIFLNVTTPTLPNMSGGRSNEGA